MTLRRIIFYPTINSYLYSLFIVILSLSKNPLGFPLCLFKPLAMRLPHRTPRRARGDKLSIATVIQSVTPTRHTKSPNISFWVPPDTNIKTAVAAQNLARRLILKLFNKSFKPGQVKFPLGDKVAAAVGFVCFAQSFPVFGVATIVDFHKMFLRPFLPSCQLSSAYL